MKRIIDELHRYKLNISAITHWEISMLEAKGRITLKVDCLNWLTESIRKTKVHVVDLLRLVDLIDRQVMCIGKGFLFVA